MPIASTLLGVTSASVTTRTLEMGGLVQVVITTSGSAKMAPAYHNKIGVTDVMIASITATRKSVPQIVLDGNVMTVLVYQSVIVVTTILTVQITATKIIVQLVVMISNGLVMMVPVSPDTDAVTDVSTARISAMKNSAFKVACSMSGLARTVLVFL